MAAQNNSGQIVTLYNGRGGRPGVKQGGKTMPKAKAKSNSGGGRGRKSGGGQKAAAGSGSSSRGRGRGKSTNWRQKYERLRAQSNTTKPKSNGRGRGKGRGKAKGNGRRSWANPAGLLGSASNIVGQLFFGGMGAFACSTASQLNPIQTANVLWATVMDIVLALGVAWAGGKIFPKQRDTIRIGAFAFVAGNIVTRYAPNLQQQIVSLSPVKRPLQLTEASPIDEGIADVVDVQGWGGFNDVMDVQQAGGQYF